MGDDPGTPVTGRPAFRCRFVETPLAGGSNSCDGEPAYRIWVENCRACGVHLGLPGVECCGHWACIPHGAEIRSGQLLAPGGGDLIVARMQTAR